MDGPVGATPGALAPDASERLAVACALPAEPDPSFDRFARLVRTQLGVPVALVSLVTRDEQVFPGALGLPAPVQAARRTPLTHSVCQHVVLSERTLLLPDIRDVPALVDNLAFADLGVVAYAGAPLTDADGVVVGSLCAIDGVPRDWTVADASVLEDLAAACSSEIALRQLRDRSHEAEVAARRSATALTASRAAALESERQARVMLRLAEGLGDATTVEEIADAITALAREDLGVEQATVVTVEAPGRVRLRGSWLRAEDETRLARRVDATTPVGSVLADGRALHYTDRAAMLAAHPGLADEPASRPPGARAYLPLVSADAVTGVLALRGPGSRAVDLATRRVLAAMTRYTAVAVARALLLADRRAAAETLQQSMLTALPSVPGLELHAEYHAAGAGDRVGGDWYDAVVLPEGATALVIGDVVGHDLRAAGAMGQLRSTVRALTWAFDEPPSQVLGRADRAAHDLGTRSGATCLLAVLRPLPGRDGDHRLTWSSAGHLPPVVLGSDGAARTLAGRSSLMLGVDPGTTRADHEVVLAAGSTLLLLTDGLVERRDRSLAEGLRELVVAVERHATLPLPDLVAAVVDDLAPRARTDRRRRTDDDIAVLSVRLPGDVRRPPAR